MVFIWTIEKAAYLKSSFLTRVVQMYFKTQHGERDLMRPD